MLKPTDILSIGDLSARTGLSVSAIRYYEAEGLIAPPRSPSGQRRFFRADIRRLSFVMIVQRLGYSVAEIKALLNQLPRGRTPTQSDWTRLSKKMRADLTKRLETISRLRDNLDGCIGCGCLSLKRCALYNPQDKLQSEGAGPVTILGRTK
jgi:MerR family transcriptional regulator, redox-sensitive transcriptional activator SoxR